jgi:hypothetical protein
VDCRTVVSCGAETAAMLDDEIAARPMLMSSAEGTDGSYPKLSHVEELVSTKSVTAAAPHCDPMHCATALAQALVVHIQLRA